MLVKFSSNIPVSNWLKKQIEELLFIVQDVYNEKHGISEPNANLSLVHDILSKNIPKVKTKLKEITFYNKEPIGKAKTIIDKIENSIKAKFADQNITYITIEVWLMVLYFNGVTTTVNYIK